MQGCESLARFVTTPPCVSRPLPGAISDSDFETVYTHGMSVQRIRARWKTQKKDAHRRAEALAALRRQSKPDETGFETRQYLGCFHFRTSEVREILLSDETTPRLRVYDTAIRGNRMHAEVFADDTALDKKRRKHVRQELRTRLLALALTQNFYKSPYLAMDDPAIRALGIEGVVQA